MTSLTLLLVLLLPLCFCQSNERPNFVIILTDDQDITLGGADYMPNLQKYIVNEGLTFNNAYVATPICCPSRSELLSGQFYQNIYQGTNGACMHVNATGAVFSSHSLFQVLHNNGYKTGMFGKLTNNMDDFFCTGNSSENIVSGMDRVHAPCNYNNYYGNKYFDKYENGTQVLRYLDITESLYQTSMIGNHTLQWLDSILSDDSTNAPFFAYIGPHAPHYPSTVSPYYSKDLFANISAPRTPNFNLYSPDKHAMIANNPGINSEGFEFIDQLYRDRLGSLISVDLIIKDLYELLDTYNVLNNTYILFTSDHGYHLGQFRVGCSKEQIYETDIKVPLYIRGPNIKYNSLTNILTGNTDITPTFYDLANINIPNIIDGKSFKDYLFNPNNNSSNNWRDEYLIQYKSVGTYYFNHCQTWFQNLSSDSGKSYLGYYKNPPEYGGYYNNIFYYVDDEISNNWRALRIINSSMNIIYGEFVDYSWNNTSFNNPNFIEMYDLNKDPYQITNLAINASQNTINELHNMLIKYGQCSGQDCI